MARVGGDEFLVVCEDLSSRAAVDGVAEKLLAIVRDPVELQGLRLKIGLSVGIALIPSDGDSPRDLIQAADIAMYHVKKSSKNSFAYASDASS